MQKTLNKKNKTGGPMSPNLKPYYKGNESFFLILKIIYFTPKTVVLFFDGYFIEQTFLIL